MYQLHKYMSILLCFYYVIYFCRYNYFSPCYFGMKEHKTEDLFSFLRLSDATVVEQ